MKSNRLFIGASLCTLLLAASGCGRDSVDEVLAPDGKVTINASAGINGVGDADTRVTLGADGLTPCWENGDQIAVKVDDGKAENLTLSDGAGTKKGEFSGIITAASGTKMYACYPPSAVAGQTDLTAQTGEMTDAARNIVMFAETSYSTTPNFYFKNKVSILKLNMEVPAAANYDAAAPDLHVKVVGAYSKGTLGADGNWTETSSDIINVSNAKIIDDNGTKRISAYVVVIPGSSANDIRVLIGGKTSNGTYANYITGNYTQGQTVETNMIVTINKALSSQSANFKDTYSFKSNFYRWGANKTIYAGGKYNATPNSIFLRITTASQSDIIKYINSGEVYWDGGYGDETNGKKSYMGLKNGVTFTKATSDDKILGSSRSTGVWLLKRVYWPATSGTLSGISPVAIDETNVSVRTDGKHFFLPVAGYLTEKSGTFTTHSSGYYWSNTKDSNTDAYSLSISSTKVQSITVTMENGYLPLNPE